ncbi:Hypothetical_protein [Hexamita inflata]|uniref:Hypothetical_protein n=1 Tax=Hexamita inflata TaxID=28002 RepID=A0ABP1I9P9_9EUKA
MIDLVMIEFLVSKFIELLNIVYKQNFIVLEHAVEYFKQLSLQQKRSFAAKWADLDDLIGVGQKYIVQRQEKKTFSYNYIICPQIINNIKEYAMQCMNANIQYLTFQNYQEFRKYIIQYTLEHFDTSNSLYDQKQIKLLLRDYVYEQVYKYIEMLKVEQGTRKLDPNYGYYDDGQR